MNKTEAILKFSQMLSGHDWYFVMTDDNQVYKAGQESIEAILDSIDNAHPDLQQLFQEMYRIASDEHQITTI